MAVRVPPLKPETVLSAFVVNQRGEVKLVQERLPREQKSAELAIAEKFVEALRVPHGIQLVGLRKGGANDEPADCICQTIEGKPVLLQLAEVVNAPGRLHDQSRRAYLLAIARTPQLRQGLRGCRVTIADDAGEPLPPVASPKGRVVVNRLVAELESAGVAFRQEPSDPRHKRVKLDAGTNIEVTARFETYRSDQRRMFWQLGQMLGVRELKERLAEGIARKVEKRYAKPRRGEFWLIVHSDLIAFMKIKYLTEATALLNASPPPFDQVWLFSPFPKRINGDALRVWPR